MAMPANGSLAKVIILIAPGFEERGVVYFLAGLREAGLPVSLVSLSAGLVTGLHGLPVRPDYTMEQLIPDLPGRMVIIPDGQQCVSALLADPRVHRLLDSTVRDEGHVATTILAGQLLAQAGIPANGAAARFVSQGDQGIADFTNQLINLLL